MNKRLVVKQNGYKDCAVACLVSIMRYYDVYPLYEEVSYLLKVGRDGTNAFNIINGAREMGFDGYGVHYSIDELFNCEVRFPIICHTINSGYYHFEVLYGKKKNKFIVMDPSLGIKYISKSDFEKYYLGSAIVIYPVKKISSFSKHESMYTFIFDYLKTKKHELLKIIMISFIVTLLGMISSFYLKSFIEKTYNYSILIIITSLMLILALFKNSLNYVRDNLIVYLESDLSSYINITMYRKLFNLPYLFFKNKSTSEVISRIDDLSSFRKLLSSLVVNSSMNIIFIICSFIILLSINYKLLCICLIEIIFYLLITIIFKRKTDYYINEMLESNSNYKQIINDSINGYESNKNINMLNTIIKKIEIRYLSYINKYNLYNKHYNIEYLTKNIINDAFYLFELFASILFYYKNIISIGDVLLFNSILFYFKDPIKNIIDMNHDFIYLESIYKRINDLFLCKTNNEKLIEYKLNSDIYIKGLSYSIDGIHNIFSNVNLKIKNKSKYLIYGDSGNGKSTLCKILLKYLNDYKGEILFNKTNLKDIESSVISYNFTYVSQNSYLNCDTFKNNIIYDRSISDNEYESVIDICNLKSLRDSKSFRNDFLIEDNGFNISGGEKQKIILARSLLKDSNYLILDEVLSEVEIDEEIDIIKRIFEVFKDKTIIYISHKKELLNLFNDKYELERSKEV